jgi:hypothetical protein
VTAIDGALEESMDVTVGTSIDLGRLEQLKASYGRDVAARKMELLQLLAGSRLKRAGEVARLHEVLCFLRAYPDSRRVLDQVERMLEGFAARRDLRAHRSELVNSGIAGTEIRFPFFWFTAERLARRWPDRISIAWAEFKEKSRIEDALRQLVHYAESPALDELDCTPQEWLRRLKGPKETDAYFLIRRFGAYPSSSSGREAYYESFGVPIRLHPGPDTPSRTRAKYHRAQVVFQTRPLSRVRPRLRPVILNAPIRSRAVPPAEARKLIWLARESMITRSRDLDAFEHASHEDVRLVDCGGGLEFAAIGVKPERRLLLESLYAFLTLKNGVPIGYVLATALFGSSEVAFNVFETYRGGESALILSRVLATVRHLFGSDTFTVDPYQLGYANTEGLKSGAWWFYYKLGFRPHDPAVRKVLAGELESMKRRPGHRSSIATLGKLASENVFLHLGRQREDVLGVVSPGEVGLKVARTIADRFGADRERAARVLSREAAKMLGLRSVGGLSRDERLAWERWAPLVMSLPGAADWSAADKRDLIRVIRAKGGRRETDFVRLLDLHGPLRKALLALAKEEDKP